MKSKRIIILLISVCIASIYTERPQTPSMQDINIAAGFGVDMKKETDGNAKYAILFSAYDYKSNVGLESGMLFSTITNIVVGGGEISSKVLPGRGKNIGETREDRQLRSDKNPLPGVQKIIVFSEEKARYSISDVINTNFASAKTNDRSIVVVCKSNTEDLLKYKINGYPSSADYIEGMIKNAINYNFMTKEYNLLNTYLRLDTEGRTIVMPYIELNEKGIVLTGMAIFKGDKMTYVLPMEESRLLNILREKKGKGILTIQNSSKGYINYDATAKKRVKCKRIDGKYNFDIDLAFNGDIVENTLYKDLDKKNQKQIEKLMEKEIEEKCTIFIEKMKEVYKMDFLELGMYAAAKYGRDTGVDWNEIVCNSNITVHIKVKIDKLGIGHYGDIDGE